MNYLEIESASQTIKLSYGFRRESAVAVLFQFVVVVVVVVFGCKLCVLVLNCVTPSKRVAQ